MSRSQPVSPPDTEQQANPNVVTVASLPSLRSGLVLALCYLGAAGATVVFLLAIMPWFRHQKARVFLDHRPPPGETKEVARVDLNKAGARLTAFGTSRLDEEGSLFDQAGLDSFRQVDRSRTPRKLKVIPRSQRWQVYFPEGLSQGPYARQIDALGVEMGVLIEGGTVEYASGLSKSTPSRRTGKIAEEKRLYLTWSRGDLVQADRTLLNNAGVPGALDNIVLHFCPPGTEEQMAEMERKFQDREPKDIYITRFALKETFRGYRLYVLEQILRE